MIIESDDYRVEEATLKADPIVIAMAEEIKEMVTEEEMHGHVFMGAANAARGGTQSKTIGGVARAIRSLLSESNET